MNDKDIQFSRGNWSKCPTSKTPSMKIKTVKTPALMPHLKSAAVENASLVYYLKDKN